MRNKGFASILDKYSRVMLLLVIIIGMSILRPDAFLTWSNMSTVIFQQAPFTMLMSFGMTPVSYTHLYLPNWSFDTLPMKPTFLPSRARPTAMLAGEPPR